MKNALAAILVLAMTSSAMADVEGVWSTKAGCDWRARGNDVNYPKDFETISYLSSKGVTGWEWGCEFLSKSVDKDGRIVYISSCGAEGDSWPDILMLDKGDRTGWKLIFKNITNKADVMDFPVRCE